MKLFGYDVTDGDDRTKPRELREASLLVDAAELRAIAGFLLRCADLMDAHGGRFGHEHLSDHLRPQCLDADLIVVAAADPAH
ncbi:MAG: hypothetical protein JNK64_15765 [Myxococcales bacterium]|nr:hypothetical protein [Myxococcales bacterium]